MGESRVGERSRTLLKLRYVKQTSAIAEWGLSDHFETRSCKVKCPIRSVDESTSMCDETRRKLHTIVASELLVLWEPEMLLRTYQIYFLG